MKVINRSAFSVATRSNLDHVALHPPSVHIVPYLTGGLMTLIRRIKLNGSQITSKTGHFTNDNGHFILHGDCMLAQRYKVVKVLSTGGQSSVIVQALDTFQNDKVVVIKILHRKFYALGAQESYCLLQLSRADPRDVSHTLKLFNTFSFDEHYCMVLESLHPNDLLKVFSTVPSFEVLMKLRQVTMKLLQVLAFLERQNVIHADLKPENILFKNVNDLNSLKVVDFGNAIHCVHNEVSLYYDDFELQTPLYRAPEVMFGMPFSTEIDMWSLGCILAELYSGKPLFNGENKRDIMKEVTMHFCEIKSIMTTSSAEEIQQNWVLKHIPLMFVLCLECNKMPSAMLKHCRWHLVALKMVEILGPFPCKLFQRGKFYDSHKHFTADVEQADATFRIMKCMNGCRDFTFANFLAGFLRYNPDERLTPLKAAQHPFMEEFGFSFFLPSTHGKQSSSCGVSITSELYQHTPVIAKNILRQHPSSYDLLKLGTTGGDVSTKPKKGKIAVCTPFYRGPSSLLSETSSNKSLDVSAEGSPQHNIDVPISKKDIYTGKKSLNIRESIAIYPRPKEDGTNGNGDRMSIQKHLKRKTKRCRNDVKNSDSNTVPVKKCWVNESDIISNFDPLNDVNKNISCTKKRRLNFAGGLLDSSNKRQTITQSSSLTSNSLEQSTDEIFVKCLDRNSYNRFPSPLIQVTQQNKRLGTGQDILSSSLHTIKSPLNGLAKRRNDNLKTNHFNLSTKLNSVMYGVKCLENNNTECDNLTVSVKQKNNHCKNDGDKSLTDLLQSKSVRISSPSSIKTKTHSFDSSTKRCSSNKFRNSLKRRSKVHRKLLFSKAFTTCNPDFIKSLKPQNTCFKNDRKIKVRRKHGNIKYELPRIQENLNKNSYNKNSNDLKFSKKSIFSSNKTKCCTELSSNIVGRNVYRTCDTEKYENSSDTSTRIVLEQRDFTPSFDREVINFSLSRDNKEQEMRSKQLHCEQISEKKFKNESFQHTKLSSSVDFVLDIEEKQKSCSGVSEHMEWNSRNISKDLLNNNSADVLNVKNVSGNRKSKICCLSPECDTNGLRQCSSGINSTEQGSIRRKTKLKSKWSQEIESKKQLEIVHISIPQGHPQAQQKNGSTEVNPCSAIEIKSDEKNSVCQEVCSERFHAVIKPFFKKENATTHRKSKKTQVQNRCEIPRKIYKKSSNEEEDSFYSAKHVQNVDEEETGYCSGYENRSISVEQQNDGYCNETNVESPDEDEVLLL